MVNSRGQGSIEFLLIIVIVLSVAGAMLFIIMDPSRTKATSSKVQESQDTLKRTDLNFQPIFIKEISASSVGSGNVRFTALIENNGIDPIVLSTMGACKTNSRGSCIAPTSLTDATGCEMEAMTILPHEEIVMEKCVVSDLTGTPGQFVKIKFFFYYRKQQSKITEKTKPAAQLDFTII